MISVITRRRKRPMIRDDVYLIFNSVFIYYIINIITAYRFNIFIPPVLNNVNENPASFAHLNSESVHNSGSRGDRIPNASVGVCRLSDDPLFDGDKDNYSNF